MPVLYLIYSIAGWLALALFLVYWAGFGCGKKSARKESQSTLNTHEHQP
jgi:hypothetical protein